MADKLANVRVNQEDKMVSHVIPSDDIILLLETDMRGVPFEGFLKKRREKESERPTCNYAQ